MDMQKINSKLSEKKVPNNMIEFLEGCLKEYETVEI